jgi:hypothetical protein
MTLAVRIAGTLKRAAEVELRLLGIANRPAALIALKLDERFRLIASALIGHLARAHGSTAASWCDSRVDDIPAEGGNRRGRRKAHAEKKKKGRGIGDVLRLSGVPRHFDLCSSRIPAHSGSDIERHEHNVRSVAFV